MSPTQDDSAYTFIPWVRRGLSAFINTTEGDLENGGAPRAAFTVGLTVHESRAALGGVPEGDGQDTELNMEQLRLYGPGDVTGIDEREIVRVEPVTSTWNFENSICPAIEFQHPDFPWLFTPVGSTGDRLRPWVVLVVVREDSCSVETDPRRPLPVLTVYHRSELLCLRESWAWAHVQVAGRADLQSLDVVMKDNPENVLSRILCPRHLSENTAYRACLVPAFEAGRRAGLGQEPGPGQEEGQLAPAWDHEDTSPVQLPIYYQWEFSTGAAGDFRSLARLLQARRVPPGTGQRAMDIAEPGFDYGQSSGTGQPLLGLEGALHAAGSESTPWCEPERQAFQAKLLDILNTPDGWSDDGADPTVAPPIYGCWHAAVSTVPEEGELPRWLGTLNRDPRFRAAAGLGTVVVQKHQEHLMASAWEQAGDLEETNALLRQSQLGREVSRCLYQKQIRDLPVDALLPLTSPVHSRVSVGPRTLRKQLATSRIPLPVLSPAFRRVTRPAGTLARGLFGATQAAGRSLLQRLNRGEITPAGPRKPPTGTVSMDDVSDALLHPLIPSWLRRWLPHAHLIIIGLGLLVFLLSRVLAVLGFAELGAVLTVATLVLIMIGGVLRRWTAAWQAGRDGRMESMTPERVATVPGQQTFGVSASGIELSDDAFSARRGSDSVEAARFRSAAAAHQEMIFRAASVRPKKTPPEIDLDTIRSQLLQQVDPEVTIARRILGRIDMPADIPRPADPLEPIMVAPRFPQPMYGPLKEIGEEYFLPGISRIQPNTITLLESNNRFVEAYMVGLNHEMARELLWRGYPTDQRGTYFRQFWETSPETSDDDEENGDDIPAIHEWPPGSDLGSNALVQGEGSQLVLLIRGELLRRYPRCTIYAARAEWTEEERRRPRQEGTAADDILLLPTFWGTLDPDINFMGFDLDASEARGSRDPEEDPGWFFVIQQQPTEPRFGADNTDEWQGLVQEDDANAASLAAATLRRPLRVAIHADRILPA